MAASRRLRHRGRRARHVASVPAPLAVPGLEGALSTRDSTPYRRLRSRPAAPTAIEPQPWLNPFSPQLALIGKQQARKRGGYLHSNASFCFARSGRLPCGNMRRRPSWQPNLWKKGQCKTQNRPDLPIMHRVIRKTQPESEFDCAESFSQFTTARLPLESRDRFAIEQSQPRLGFSFWPNGQLHLRGGICRG